ncbi:Hemolymph lipopolysaccharide-binding protein [Ooceraea biroi]|uniref:Hemolymph lipopolysaccharide-binding protein n=1 Tax=Ooceraea biroi TaxID=2015173 RepID=A0A026W9Y2_OOCBI|nr:Hemolymph lipopolysaccharide-binding protein [Ooceraea biroi]
MNGHYNYHVGQQIIYVYGQQQFKRLFTANNLEEKSVGGDYLITSGIGAHKLHLRRLCWNKARQVCVHEGGYTSWITLFGQYPQPNNGGGHLAIINSALEEMILIHMLQDKNVTAGWLGLHDFYEEGDWVTILDESLESTGYTRWTTKWPNEPNNAEELNKNPTVTLNGYNNIHVGQQIFYIYNVQQLEGLLPNNTHTKKLKGDGWLITPGSGAHKLHLRRATWNNARKACIQEGGHLAIINSTSEEKVLLRMMQEKNISAAWLGLHDLYEEGDWVSILDEPLENTGYTSWTTKWPNQPDNNGGNQNCAALVSPEGGMDDVQCGILLHFFCKLPA